ncbi:MAG: hypothetical protein HYX24_03185 [Candidatus Aenigmarchaeota archaeon]|nr:hypothetical protein [Candidatus Aenigmarchaeota archaeon]
MKIDKVTDWLIRKTLVPRLVTFDTPGFIQEAFTFLSKVKFPLRNVILVESVFADLERQLTSEFGGRAKNVLYQSGRDFGRRYCNLEKVPNISDDNRAQTFYFFIKTFETVFAEELKDEVDWDKKRFSLNIKKFIICPKSGSGAFFTEGVVTGYWRSICDDATIEGIQVSCEGRGDKNCSAVYGPHSLLSKEFKNVYKTEREEKIAVPKEYASMNKTIERRSNYAVSMQNLLDSKKVIYDVGKFLYKGERLFPMELSSLQILERKILESFGKAGQKIVFDSAYKIGNDLAQSEVNKEKEARFIAEHISAFGFGMPTIIPSESVKIYVSGFPWSEYFSSDTNKYFEGLISGMASCFFKGAKVGISFKKKTTWDATVSIGG